MPASKDVKAALRDVEQRFDEWKRNRLLGVGADVVIPDFGDSIPLLDHILGRYPA